MATNPYLQDQTNAITQTATNNLRQNILPNIGGGAVAAGGYGGSRQGIAEGLAIGQTNQGISNAVANLQGNAYQFDQANETNRMGLNNQYNLGLGNLGLQNQQQGLNFYTQQRGLDQSGAQLGANLVNSANAGYVGQGAGIGQLGATQQQAPWTALQNASNIYSQFSGLGGTQTQTQPNSPFGNAVGGALAGAQVGSNLGLSQNPYTTPNSTGSYSNPAGSTYDYRGGYLDNSLRGGG